jgi:hypothetical protein
MANPSRSKAKYAARGVHLDQDTAGRLLESMGDHARREMIVRITRVIRQNPAYRPSVSPAHDPPIVLSRGVLCFALIASAACATHGPLRPGETVPVAQRDSSPSAPPPASPGTWSFAYLSGTTRYRISRSAAIESLSDSAPHREISTNVTHEIITVDAVSDTLRVAATIDTFTVTTQGTIGSVQRVELPVRLTASIVGSSLAISEADPSGCNAASSVLATDLRSLLSPIPAQLSSGARWRDSTDVVGCQAGVSTTSRLIRSYLVMGQAVYENRPVVLVQRADTITAHGEGTQQQHHISVEANGSGTGIYYLSPESGKVVKLSMEQVMDLSVTASSRVSRFRQTSRQDFSLLP